MELTRLQANPMQNSFILGDITFLVGLQFKKGYNIRNALNFFEQALIPLHLKIFFQILLFYVHFKDSNQLQRKSELAMKSR